MDLVYVILVALLIIAIEWVLWHLFVSKSKGLIFPLETDESSFRVATPIRLRLFAIAHTAFLLTLICSALLFRW